MTTRTTTTAFHETECDHCHTIESSTGEANSQPTVPDGWRKFTANWSAPVTGDPPPPPWAANTISLDLCPPCQPLVTLAECVAKYEQRQQEQRQNGSRRGDAP